MMKGKMMGKGYEEFMQKAHGALILERENDIIVELRATREYLEQKIEDFAAEVNARFDSVEKRMDSIEKRMDSIEKRMDSIEKRMDSLESKLDVIIDLLKAK